MNERMPRSLSKPEYLLLSAVSAALIFCPFAASGEEGSSSKMTPFDSDEVAINLEIGDMASRSGDHDSAIAAYSRAYLLDNKCFEAVYNLAYSFQLKGLTKEAVKYYKTASRIDAKRHEPYLNLGAIYMTENDLKAASEMFKAVLERAPGNFDAPFNLAVISIDEGDHKEALARLDAAAKTLIAKSGREYNSVALKSALCRIALGEYDAAAKLLNFNSDDAVEEIEKFYLTGCMFHKAGRHGEAAKAFAKALELSNAPEMESLRKVVEEKIAAFKTAGKTGRISN